MSDKTDLKPQILVIYHENQNVEANDSFSPSASKPKQVVESWKKLNIQLVFAPTGPLRADLIEKVHSPEYVRGVLNLSKPNGFGNYNPQVAAALPWICGSMVTAALTSLESGIPTFSPTSGAHHAHYDHGGGFCTFNFLVLAAVLAKEAGAKKIGIVDLDMHAGDGTRDICGWLNLDYIQHYSFGEQNIRRGKSAEEWLKKLPEVLFSFEGCDLIIYNAGVDSHIDDSLGGILTTEQLRKRDMIVYETAFALGIPISTSLAGGYQRDSAGTIAPVLALHDNTIMECLLAYSERLLQIPG